MSEGERARLIAQLQVESNEMQDKFAMLVDKTREELERQNKTGQDFQVLVKHCHKSKLYHIFQKHNSIKTIFLKLSDYWSFFDYEFLGMIISHYCQSLIANLDSYIEHFKAYCQRRLCEIPIDVFKTKQAHKNNLYIKCDENFEEFKLIDLKTIEIKLSKLLDKELYILRIDEGCIEVVFNSLIEMDDVFPLREYQLDILFDMGILLSFNCYDKFLWQHLTTCGYDLSAIQETERIRSRYVA